ncbi:plasmid replication protein RepC [Pseudovibrio ascidiaceicola]|uniref:plasmid replication protein RepC n=1 Tax=Pseudovibrio ascidiaceicola TaxID=285279 RepID=UPI003D36C3E2
MGFSRFLADWLQKYLFFSGPARRLTHMMNLSINSFRKLTPAIIKSQKLASDTNVVETTKTEVASALKKAAPALGIKGTAYHILDILLALSKADDWNAKRKPIVAISNEKLAEYVCRSKRTVSRAISSLVEAGVLAYKDSPTGRRFIHRETNTDGEEGKIKTGFGLDFSPARQRVRELAQIATSFAKKLAAEKEARRSVTRLSRAIADMIVYGEENELPVGPLVDALTKVTNTSLPLAECAERLEEIHDMGIEILSAPFLRDEKEHTSCAGDIIDAPIHNTNSTTPNFICNEQASTLDHTTQTPETDAKSSMAFEDVKGNKSEGEKADTRPMPHPSEAIPDSKLTIGMISAATLQMQEAFDLKIENWSDMNKASQDLCAALGVSTKAFNAACMEIDRRLALGILAVTCEKMLRDPSSISNIGGYFRACVSRARTGKFALNRTVFGLIKGQAACQLQ